MTPIRLLAMDLDDTLLHSDLSISLRTRNVLRKAQTQGIIVALASSRDPVFLDKFSVLLGLSKWPGYVIANNGTLVQESMTGTIIFEAKIPIETALMIFDIADAEGFTVQIYDDDIMYVSHKDKFTDINQKTSGIRHVVVENFRSMTAAGCHKMLIPGKPEKVASLARILDSYADRVTIQALKPHQLEVLPLGVDKGSALAKVAERCSISREEVLAIGDSMNDESMLRWAGCSVAMKNADSKLKEIAVFVTDKSNDEDGVAEVIERYILHE